MNKPQTTLLPCPFDGKDARLFEVPKGYGARPMFVIECSVCRIAKQWANKERVINEWNTRI